MTCKCVYATADNTPAVRDGYEMGGYLKEECDECKSKEAETSEAVRYVRPGQLDTFINDEEQPMKCPLCQARTDFVQAHGQQLHWCLNDKCKLIFLSEDDQGEAP